jgi:hypothetical protein
METNKKLILLLFSCFFILNSCKENNTLEIYKYKIYNESNHIGFEKLKISKSGNNRIDSTFRYSKDMVIQDTTVFDYQMNNKGLFIDNNKYYLDISKDTCYMYQNKILENFQICYDGTESIEIEDKLYPIVHKFSILETYGDYSSHSLKTRKYFDENFVLLRNELVEGNRRYFRVDRVDK